MRYSLSFLLFALMCALPLLAAPAGKGIQIGKRNSSATKTAAHVQKQQANPIAISANKARALEAPSKLQPRAPQASKRMGQRRRRSTAPDLKKKDYSSFLCPGGAVACPVVEEEITPFAIDILTSNLNSVADWFRIGFECIELDTELNQCGGCTALGKGQDCAKIENARATGCEKGACVVFSCNVGYVPSPSRDSCIRKDEAEALLAAAEPEPVDDASV